MQIPFRGQEIETLKKELDSAGHGEQDFKKMHRNYMLKMQYLCQNVIAPPASKDGDAPVPLAAEFLLPPKTIPSLKLRRFVRIVAILSL